MSVTPLEICLCIRELQAQHKSAAVPAHPLKPALLQHAIELRGATAELSGSATEGPVARIQLPGFLFESVTHFAAFFQEVCHPVIVGLIPFNGVLHALRNLQLIVVRDCLLCAFDDPLSDVRASICQKVLGVVLDIAFPGDLRVKRDHNEPAPDTRIHGANPGQVIGIQDEGVRRPELERVAVLLFRGNLIRGAKLFHD